MGLKVFKLYSIALVLMLSVATELLAYTANQVSFEFLSNGTYRVNLYYTVPSLKEFRQASIVFVNLQKAETFYFDVVRGADFYIDEEAQTQFVNEPMAPSPW